MATEPNLDTLWDMLVTGVDEALSRATTKQPSPSPRQHAKVQPTMSDTVDIRLLGEQVRKLQEDVRGIKLAIDALGPVFQAAITQFSDVVGRHLAVQDRRFDNIVNVLREQGEALARIENKLDDRR